MPFSGRVLGIEGTAWNLSAAVFGNDLITISSRPYQPASGGIHPREAAQHHAAEIKGLIQEVLTDPDEITGIAFSMGPGLGPCLRTVATAARSLSLALGVPLIGVNHCIAHVEIGRYATGCSDPVVLYASGANTQVIGYLNSRYRIFGETLDIGIGNALDKFARSLGLPHPGGPEIERIALDGSWIDLPYTVKGMDLAFSGLVSAAKDAKAPPEDLCFSIQETGFAMCVEVAERALAHTGKDEILLVGGVGANRRFQEMVGEMAQDRGAELFIPESRYLGDNGAMIAYTGRIMLEHGCVTRIGDSFINPCSRVDQVPVMWRDDAVAVQGLPACGGSCIRGAEANDEIGEESVTKRRCPKHYRSPDLDRRLITERTRSEARLISMARRCGVPTPIIRDVTSSEIIMERIHGEPLKDRLTIENLGMAGRLVGTLHSAGIVHGDLTTSNILVRDKGCVLIDFGLSTVSDEIEARGVDIHVVFQTLESTAADPDTLKGAFASGYACSFSGADDVLAREKEIRLRGRYL